MHAEFQENGYVILRGIARHAAPTWLEEYNRLGTERTPEFNPVAVNAPKHAELLDDIANWPPILDAVCEIFGPDIATYNRRFVVKDKHSRGPVFWHQDTGYHMGWPQKCSVFVAMSQVEPERGGLIIARGSHHYGFMGDAGELNIDVLPESQHSRMDIRMIAGDVLIMHSACWHSSHAHTSGADRVLSDVIYQPASDCVPEFLRKPFIRSRVDRIKELETELDNWKEEC